MNDLNAAYLKFLNKLSRRFVILIVLIIVGMVLLQNPNPLTHKCVPNIRTQMGLPQDGYPNTGRLAPHFCKTGYYPQLKFGQEDALANRMMILLFILVPLMLITPVAFILYSNHLARQKQATATKSSKN